MISWEFPPYASGGLGTHTYELSKELAKRCRLILLIPSRGAVPSAEGIELITVPLKHTINAYGHAGDLIGEVESFNEYAFNTAKNLSFDVIHCHDWLTISAGIRLKELTKKPLVFTVHSTEYDRTIGFPWKHIEHIEKQGLIKSDKVITVSSAMKKQLTDVYKCPAEKIKVIPNAVRKEEFENARTKTSEKILAKLFIEKLSSETNKKSGDFNDYLKKLEQDIDTFCTKRKKIARIPKNARKKA